MTRFKFEDFMLDLSAGDLRRGDSRVEMRAQLFNLLAYLIEHHDRLVTKEEIIAKLWPDVHVSDASLNRAIADLRQVLGDDSREPRMVETVPRRGYRFIAEIETTGQTPAQRTLSSFVLTDGTRHLPLFEGENVVGRTPRCDVQIVSGSVSRRHAVITVDGQTVVVEDVQSTNGTFVRDKPVEGRTAVESGDDLRFGKEALRLFTVEALNTKTDRL